MKAKFCFRFNLRSVVGAFITVLGTLQLVFWPIAHSYTKYGKPDGDVSGWSVITIACGAMLLAWGEFCEKGDC